ncbi:hypothetical protein PANI_CDS0083 [Maribacter phage Panino]
MKKERTVLFPNWTRKDRTYILAKDATPVSEQLNSRHTKYNTLQYFDKELQYPRSLRYVTNQTTFFEDEQVEPYVLGAIVFNDGKLVVKSTDTVLQQFLAVHPDNKTNGGVKFYEFDPEKAAQEDLKKELQGYEAVAVAMEMSIEDLEAVGRVLLANVDSLTSSELKRDIIRKAKADPKAFIELANNSDLKMRNLAQRAIDYGLIEIKDDNVTIVWAGSGNEITKIPFSMEPLNTFAQFLKTDKGLELQEQFLAKMS